LVSDSDLEVLESILLEGSEKSDKRGSIRKESKMAKTFSLIVKNTNTGGIDTKELMQLVGFNHSQTVINTVTDIRGKLEQFNQVNTSSVEYRIYSTKGGKGFSSRFYVTEVKKKEVDTPTSPDAPINRPQEPDKRTKLISALDQLATEEGIDSALNEAKSLFKLETNPELKKGLEGFIHEMEGLLSEGEELEASKHVKDPNKGKVRGRGMESIYKPEEIVDYTQVPILAGEIPWQFQDFSLLGIHLTNGVKICLDFVDHSKAIVSMIDVLKASKFSSFSQLRSLIKKYSELANPTQIIKGDKKLGGYNIYIHFSGGPDCTRNQKRI
jgi:hypothetical protein